MNDKNVIAKEPSFILGNEEKDNGFSLMTDEYHNKTLLKHDEPVAWFSAAMSTDTIREFIDLMKCCDNHIAE